MFTLLTIAMLSAPPVAFMAGDFHVPDFVKELKLTTAQSATIAQIHNREHAAIKAQMKQHDGEKSSEWQLAFDREAALQIAKVLTPEQRQLATRLYVRRLGVAAPIYSPEIARYINASDDQIASMKDAIDAGYRALGEKIRAKDAAAWSVPGYTPPVLTPKQKAAELQAAQADLIPYYKRAGAFLTKRQREKLKALVSEPEPAPKS